MRDVSGCASWVGEQSVDALLVLAGPKQEAQAALDELSKVKGRLAERHEAYRANPAAFEQAPPAAAQAVARAPPPSVPRQARATPASSAAEIPFVPSQRSGMGFDVRDILGWGPGKGQEQHKPSYAAEQRVPQQQASRRWVGRSSVKSLNSAMLTTSNSL